jgi:hypothetical protein
VNVQTEVTVFPHYAGTLLSLGGTELSQGHVVPLLTVAPVFQSGQVGTAGDVREQRPLRHHVHTVRVGRLSADLHHTRPVCGVEDEPVGAACLLSAVHSNYTKEQVQ